jgi:methionyl-tRNA formyltransferase
MNLAGLVVLKDGASRILSVAKREIRRGGWTGFADVLAFRLFSRLALRARDNAWKRQELERLRARYPADLTRVPRIEVTSPNSEEARVFLLTHAPDLIIARCKFILKPEIFEIARVGSFALHPGVCPEYRNAHGCFWALANRDTKRVGMTMLKLDKGVDTGPVYFQAGCDIDELNESHTMIQYRVVLENLEGISRTLIDLWKGLSPAALSVEGRTSAVWGQPRLTQYLRWKRLALRERQSNHQSPITQTPTR